MSLLVLGQGTSNYPPPTPNCDMGDPYLAYLSNKEKGDTLKDGIRGAVDPLHGWIPRKVTAEQVRRAMDGDVNPFTKQSISATYRKIMESRKKLPVYGYMQTFYTTVSASVFECL